MAPLAHSDNITKEILSSCRQAMNLLFAFQFRIAPASVVGTGFHGALALTPCPLVDIIPECHGESSFLGNQFLQAPHPVCHPCRHGGSDPERAMNPTKVVEPKPEGDRCL